MAVQVLVAALGSRCCHGRRGAAGPAWGCGQVQGASCWLLLQTPLRGVFCTEMVDSLDPPNADVAATAWLGQQRPAFSGDTRIWGHGPLPQTSTLEASPGAGRGQIQENEK